MRCRSERTIFSGVVSLPRMRDIFHDRRSFVSRSLLTAKCYRTDTKTQRKNIAALYETVEVCRHELH